MSGKVSGLVLDHLPGDDHVRLVIALVLADAADHDGKNVRPSVARVALLARVAERTVQYHLRDFEKVGFLLLVRPGGGRGRPAEYRINLDWLRAQPAILRLSAKGATDAPFIETVQKGCSAPSGNGAERVQPMVHPTPDPVVLPTTTHHQVVAEVEINHLVDAAVWASTTPIKNEAAYRAKIRTRISASGPSAEDRQALVAWRKHKEKEHADDAAQELAKQEAAAKKEKHTKKTASVEAHISSLDNDERKKTIDEFISYLRESGNSLALAQFNKHGIEKSKIVKAEFVDFVDAKIQKSQQPEEVPA